MIPNPSFLPFLRPSYPIPPNLVLIQSVLGWVPQLMILALPPNNGGTSGWTPPRYFSSLLNEKQCLPSPLIWERDATGSNEILSVKTLSELQVFQSDITSTFPVPFLQIFCTSTETDLRDNLLHHSCFIDDKTEAQRHTWHVPRRASRNPRLQTSIQGLILLR